MKPRHAVWVSLAFLLVVAPAIADRLYCFAIRRQAADLHETILLTHPGWNRIPPDFCRFGDWSPECRPSLFRDLHAWISFRLDRSSELDYQLNSNYRGVHAYLGVVIHSRKEAYHDCHFFIWSPRRLRFIPSWGPNCRVPGCVWRPES